MKKKNVLNLIKYHVENNDVGFRHEAYEVAKGFDEMGDYQLAQYVMALVSNTNTFMPQISDEDLSFFRKISPSDSSLPLPKNISEDVKGIINAVGHKAGVNKFLFKGPPGTGKTETAKHVARILERELFIVDFSLVIDSKLGQTAKNITKMFQEINELAHPERCVLLLDELDALALDRTNSNDLREMGRATSTVLAGLDSLNDSVVLIATTNMYDSFDRALLRRFDATIDFDRYDREDLILVAEEIFRHSFSSFRFIGRNMRLFKKIMSLLPETVYPGELKNIIRSSIAFSSPNDEYDYLRRLYRYVSPNEGTSAKDFHERGFTLREIEILTGASKSSVARELKGLSDE